MKTQNTNLAFLVLTACSFGFNLYLHPEQVFKTEDSGCFGFIKETPFFNFL